MWNDHVCVLSLQPCPTLCSPVTVAHQAPLPMEFSRQEYWSGLPFPPPGDLPNPGTEPMSPASPALTGVFFTPEIPGNVAESVNEVTQLCLALCDPKDCSIAYQAPMSMELSRQEYWNGLPFPPPGDRPDPRIKPVCLASAGGFFTTEPPGKPHETL